MTGEVYVDGRKVDRYFERISGYVAQSDVMPPLLTVDEVITFATRLAYPPARHQSKAARVAALRRQRAQQDALLKELGLYHVKVGLSEWPLRAALTRSHHMLPDEHSADPC